ncbi:MAG TPA: aldo/keto reductase [Tepidisphaeraceae bacterium]|jgi:aryl-alcohol dehydrogenase-like predicted oxidoreductase
MQYRTLGSTGLSVSVVGIGTWQFGGEWGKNFEQTEVDAMFRRGKELGINLIDTAECYGDHLSERLIGAAIERERSEWILCTKFGHTFHGPMQRTEPRTPADTERQLDDSLAALRTDYVDVLQYHSWGDEQFLDDDVLAVLHKAKSAGKVRHIGNSVGSNTNVRQIEASAARQIEVIQIIYNRLDRKPEEGAFPVCVKQNLGVLARVPMASGYLSGKYKAGATFEKDDWRSGHKQEEVDAKLREVERIGKEEVPAGVQMAQWALAWCLKNPAVTSVIPGCKSVAQVESNAAAVEVLGKI